MRSCLVVVEQYDKLDFVQSPLCTFSGKCNYFILLLFSRGRSYKLTFVQSNEIVSSAVFRPDFRAGRMPVDARTSIKLRAMTSVFLSPRTASLNFAALHNLICPRLGTATLQGD